MNVIYLFWKTKGWSIPTDPQSLHNHRAGKHMNIPGEKLTAPGASANNGGKTLLNLLCSSNS